ncbi:PLP-dependent transferase [Thermospira aquatica]|uniref:O-acetylhomoserine aminocarboxypropyltransferase/cysteine synthase n=1 Tax=Thermospira aquatica TaxID=2828656 RepID=A0AAX3BAI4_9SPIR|nr:PLP-dependent transferase [Thermospira aquatica]URA09237.1 O-acetylhomoserine aminocarboxypropyltransferase/cysteine synthase [Thermospira aquatica]
MRISTKIIHGDFPNPDPHGSLKFPIYDSVAFEFNSAKDIENAFLGRTLAHSYSRISNPTVSEFERRLATVSDAYGVVSTSSGMAAITAVLLSISGKEANILSSPYLFGNTYSLFEKTLKRFGLSVKYIDFHNPEQIEKAIDENTVAIYLETITNPQLAIFDIESIVNIASRYRLLTLLDNTLATFYLFSSREWGINIEVISTTKYISGGATTIGGAILDYGNYDYSYNRFLSDEAQKYGKNALLVRLKREVHRNTGVCLSPHNAYLQLLGMETLPLRVEKSCSNALILAQRLIGHPKIKNVNYPGLEDSRYFKNAKKYLKGWYGSLFTLELPSKEACFTFIDNLKLIRKATNLHDNKTLIIHPASTIFCEYPPQKRKELGVSEEMVRIAVGIEDVEDIYEDIIQALEVI